MTVQPAASITPLSANRYLLSFIGILILITGVVVAVFSTNIKPLVIWLLLLALILALTLILSRAFTGRWLGVLIDERKKYSLSRLQMVVWTIVILSAFIAAVLANSQLNLVVYITGAVKPAQVIFEPAGTIVLHALYDVGVVTDDGHGGFVAQDGVDLSQIDLSATLKDGQQIVVPLAGDTTISAVQPITQDTSTSPTTTPISVEIPSEVWLLLGISTTSLVASPLIKGQKDSQIQKNDSMQEAKFSDLFKGEEGSNFMQLDLAKVQLFYFTLIVVGAYMIALASMFIKSESYITSLPALDGGVVAMLGVSHAGYLGNKAVPRPASQDDGQSGDAGGDTPPPADLPLAPTPDPSAPPENAVGNG